MVEQKIIRCAIYTRVSTDVGLEQDFNSLDAQREAADAFIKSQSHEGWRPVSQTYDDGGFSGGSLKRPALERLLQDVCDRKIDVIVVYKVDRLTRSLADFAKLVELFDKYGASFVSVTQAFNTTNSMGRLTLNVLLSFAQFEREVTAERIRDKVAASKKKGIWMGGPLPLGYRVRDRKLVVVPEEAATVKMIFKRYLELGSTLRLIEELHRTGVRTRVRHLSSGTTIGGVPFMRGAVTYLLRNRIYLGELQHHKKCYPGEHEAIVDQQTFDAVQALLKTNLVEVRNVRSQSSALLAGKVFDDRGHLMTPVHSQKGSLRYHYYVSRMVIERRRADAGTVARVPAPPLEKTVAEVVRSSLSSLPSVDCDELLPDEALLDSCLDRVTLYSGHLALEFHAPGSSEPMRTEVAWTPPPGRPKREILLPHKDAQKDQRPIKSEVRESVVRAVALGRKWLSELIANPQLTVDALAERERRSKRSVGMLLSLNFLAPDIVRALIMGKLPRGIGITKLVHLPANWSEQRELLGVAGPLSS